MTVRLLKSIVQHVLVHDDGETLTEDVRQPVEVKPGDWPGYYDRLSAELDALKAE